MIWRFLVVLLNRAVLVVVMVSTSKKGIKYRGIDRCT